MGMIRSITKRIHRDPVSTDGSPEYYALYRGETVYATGTLLGTLSSPVKSYRVRYSLDPNGWYRFTLWGGLQTPGGTFLGAVCFLPRAWAGKRLRRTILPWTGGNRGIRG